MDELYQRLILYLTTIQGIFVFHEAVLPICIKLPPGYRCSQKGMGDL